MMRFLKQYLVLFITLALFASVVQAQEPVVTLEIVGVDSAEFPTVTLSYIARNLGGDGIEVLSDLQLIENEAAILDFTQLSEPVGIDLTFIIDANDTIDGIDLIGDVTRLEKVKAAIDNYAQQYVSRAGLDRVSVIAPIGGEAAYLIENASDPDAISAAIAPYNPDPDTLPNVAPIDAMLRLAFEQAAAREPTSRYHAIMLFTDAEFLGQQVDFFAVREIATQSDVVFFSAILGKSASQGEIDNVGELIIPTNGSFVHMPQPEDADPIFRTIKSNSDIRLIRYRSLVNQSGSPTVRLIADGVITSETTYDITILPPEIEWLMPNQPIQRTGSSDESVDQLTPTMVRVETQVNWPDGHPRQLVDVRFFINDLEQRIDPPPVVDASGFLTFDWNIANLPAERYRLEIEIADELGTTARSSPFLQPIEFETAAAVEPTLEPAPLDVVPAPTTSMVEDAVDTATEVASGMRDGVNALANERNILIAMGSLIGLLALILLWRWRRKGSKAFQPDALRANHIVLPENVYLELMGARETISTRIPLLGPSVRIGSDPFRADIVLDDDSVSRYHARLSYEGGGYVLYDEGSAFGTRVNFEPIGLTPRHIQDTDELTFGSVRTRFRIYGPKENGRAPKVTVNDEPPRYSLVPPQPKPIKAVIFDLDGTLIDSESVAMVAWKATVAHFGAQFDERHQKLIIGVPLAQALAAVIEHFGLPISAETLFDKLAEEWRNATAAGLPVMPGVYDLIEALANRRIVWGVATNSEREYADYHLKSVKLYEGAGAIIGSDSVAQPKPAPDVFLACAQALQIDPSNCLAIEDTALGHNAAAAAGMTVIAVPNPWADHTEFTHADRIYTSITEMLPDLDELLKGTA